MKTLQEIENCGKDMLTPADIAPVFGCDAQSIRMQARANAGALGFPTVVMGTRVFVPREGFVRFCRGLAKEGG
jgi:hypothetical protein